MNIDKKKIKLNWNPWNSYGKWAKGIGLGKPLYLWKEKEVHVSSHCTVIKCFINGLNLEWGCMIRWPDKYYGHGESHVYVWDLVMAQIGYRIESYIRIL